MRIIDVLRSDGLTMRRFSLGSGAGFNDYPNHLSDLSQQRGRHDGIQPHADQVNPTRRELLYMQEPKPPHKFIIPHLRLCLRDMDIRGEVVNRITVPTDDDHVALFRYHTDRIVAAAASQTDHYMIFGSLEYSYFLLHRRGVCLL